MEEDSASKPEILPEEDTGPDLLEVRFRVRPVAGDDDLVVPVVALCPICEHHVTLRPDGTCPLGHEVPPS